MTFTGFNPQAIPFLKSIGRHNDKDWFDPRKAKYEQLLKEPLQDLVDDLGDLLKKDYPSLIFDGAKSPLRIYRDVRFTHDKSPYKTYVGAHFKNRRSTAKDESPTLYLHVEPGRVYLNGGVHTPSTNQLSQFREYVTRHEDAYLKVVRSAHFRKTYGTIIGEKLIKAPKGFAPDHPLIEELKHKQLLVTTGFTDADVTKPGFAKKIAHAAVEMKPFMTMLDAVFALW